MQVKTVFGIRPHGWGWPLSPNTLTCSPADGPLGCFQFGVLFSFILVLLICPCLVACAFRREIYKFLEDVRPHIYTMMSYCLPNWLYQFTTSEQNISFFCLVSMMTFCIVRPFSFCCLVVVKEKTGLPWWRSGWESAANAGDTGSSPGLGRFHMPRSN